MFSYRKLWGIYLGQFSVASTSWFFLTWFPTYLERYRGIAFAKDRVARLAALPCGLRRRVLLSGFLSDALTRRGVSPAVARKFPLITGLALSTTIVAANFVDQTAAVVGLMALAFFGNGMASIAWVFVSFLAPGT